MASLHLLSSLAQQSPLSLNKAKGNELSILLQAIISNLESTTTMIDTTATTATTSNTLQSITHQLQCMQIVFEVLNYVALACDMSYPQNLSDNPKERMIQMIQIMADNNIMLESSSSSSSSSSSPSPQKRITIKRDSKAANIGTMCLPFVLKGLVNLIQKATMIVSSTDLHYHSGDLNDNIQRIMQSISHCASTCPSLLVGGGGSDETQLLSMLCQTLIAVGENSILDPFVRLSALEALTTLSTVNDVSWLLQNEKMAKMCLVGDSNANETSKNGGVLGVCIQLLVEGVDDDVNEWAMDPVSLQVRVRKQMIEKNHNHHDCF